MQILTRISGPAISAILLGALAAGGAGLLFGVAHAFAPCIPL